jgi:hypothetical protein
MDAVSTFGDVEDPWNIHAENLRTGVNRFGHCLTGCEMSRSRLGAEIAHAIYRASLPSGAWKAPSADLAAR